MKVMDQAAYALVEGFNRRDLGYWEGLQAPDFVAEYPGARALGKEAARAYNQGFLEAFPDLHFEVHQTVAQGDMVVLHWTGAGTHLGPLQGPQGQMIPPTGRRGSLTGVFLVEVRQGKIVRELSYWDHLELMAALGL